MPRGIWTTPSRTRSSSRKRSESTLSDVHRLSCAVRAASLLPPGYEHCFRIFYSERARRCYFVEWNPDTNTPGARSYWTPPHAYDPSAAAPWSARSNILRLNRLHTTHSPALESPAPIFFTGH
jgi:hypothetical protein